MGILDFKGVLIIDYSDISNSSREVLNEIAGNTVNTWQSDRSDDEKLSDTDLGKRAENAVITAFRFFDFNKYVSYDEIRTDDFLNHAPFDGIFIDRLTTDNIILINESVSMYGAKLNVEIRQLLSEKNISTVEVKSTRVTSRRFGVTNYQSVESISTLIETIYRDDFLTYPFFFRTGDISFDEYCDYAERHLQTGKMGTELKQIIKQFEIYNSNDIFIRVYMDETNQKAIIIGWIDKYIMFNHPRLKKMSLAGKSEHALYFAKELRSAIPLSKLVELYNR